MILKVNQREGNAVTEVESVAECDNTMLALKTKDFMTKELVGH